jgi:mono/diheme cytochrome c family protein
MKIQSAALAALGLAFVVSACPQDMAKSADPAKTVQPGQTAQPAQPASQQAQQPAEQPAEQPKEAVAAVPTAEAGKALYMQGCANCHGLDGSGAAMRAMMPKLGDLTSAEMHGRMKDADIETLITNGRDKMPPFGSVFKPDQIKSIIAYVRTLKK